MYSVWPMLQFLSAVAKSGSAHASTSTAGDLAVTAHDQRYMGKLETEIARLKLSLGGDWSIDGPLFKVRPCVVHGGAGVWWRGGKEHMGQRIKGRMGGRGHWSLHARCRCA